MLTDTKRGTARDATGYKISLSLLGGLIIAFLLGFAGYGLVWNAIGGPAMTFSTPELITFILSVVLSGASIFLAIAAIALGKFSEQAMVQRSDESIHLQNEVFQKTTEALQRIESSTGVTEKRIEDIISGRVGDLSQKIARIATEKKDAEGALGPKEIEEMIRKTLLQSLRDEGELGYRRPHYEEQRRLEEEERKKREKKNKYEELHFRFLKALSMREDLKAIKIGQGRMEATDDFLFDGIYIRKDGKKIGVIDFYSGHRVESIRTATGNSLIALQRGTVEHVYVVLYTPMENFKRAFDESTAIAAPELKTKITFVVYDTEDIEKAAATLPVV